MNDSKNIFAHFLRLVFLFFSYHGSRYRRNTTWRNNSTATDVISYSIACSYWTSSCSVWPTIQFCHTTRTWSRFWLSRLLWVTYSAIVLDLPSTCSTAYRGPKFYECGLIKRAFRRNFLVTSDGRRTSSFACPIRCTKSRRWARTSSAPAPSSSTPWQRTSGNSPTSWILYKKLGNGFIRNACVSEASSSWYYILKHWRCECTEEKSEGS